MNNLRLYVLEKIKIKRGKKYKKLIIWRLLNRSLVFLVFFLLTFNLSITIIQEFKLVCDKIFYKKKEDSSSFLLSNALISPKRSLKITRFGFWLFGMPATIKYTIFSTRKNKILRIFEEIYHLYVQQKLNLWQLDEAELKFTTWLFLQVQNLETSSIMK